MLRKSDIKSDSKALSNNISIISFFFRIQEMKSLNPDIMNNCDGTDFDVVSSQLFIITGFSDFISWIRKKTNYSNII